MLSFTISSSNLVVLNFPTVLESPSRKLAQRVKKLRSLSPSNGKYIGVLKGFERTGRFRIGGLSSVVRMCKGWDQEGDFELEAEILEFMKSSKNPEVFPGKKELMDAGRMDLVEGIVKQGGWLCLGWDLDKEEEEDRGEDLDLRIRNVCNNVRGSIGSEGNELGCSRIVPSVSGDSDQSASMSGSSLEAAEDDASGIEGILNRLEKERSINLGFSVSDTVHVPNSRSRGDCLSGPSPNSTVAGLNRSSSPALFSHKDGVVNERGHELCQNKSLSDIDGIKEPTEPDTWRFWSSQRAGFSNTEFEAAEFGVNKTSVGEQAYSSGNNSEVGTSDPLNGQEDSHTSCDHVNLYHIRSRIQHLQSELSTALCTLKSNSNNILAQWDDEGSIEDLRKLSDAWEFQENEIINARDNLRSLRAKLAVLEGKMALAIIDAQKITEDKQKRIDDAHRALRLLRTACIVWPNSASEVLLAGSFDGWATQRKMEKSKTGIFSLYLKLYPGRYEIKFIVDGEWKVDPLRPVVNNGGFQNNLLIIS